jgi:hypothetical protein
MGAEMRDPAWEPSDATLRLRAKLHIARQMIAAQNAADDEAERVRAQPTTEED